MDNRSQFDDIQNTYMNFRPLQESTQIQKSVHSNCDSILEAYSTVCDSSSQKVIVESNTIKTKPNYTEYDINDEIISAYKNSQQLNEGILGDIANKAAQIGRSTVKAVKHLMAGFSKMLSNIFGKSNVGAAPEAGEIGAIHGNGFDSAKVISLADEKSIKLNEDQKDTLGDYQTKYEESIKSFIDKLKPYRDSLAKEFDVKLISKFPFVPTTIFNTKYKALLNDAKTKQIFEKFCVDLTTMNLADMSYTIDNIYKSVEECIQKTPGVDGSNGKIFEDTSSIYHIMTSCLRAPFDTSKNTRMTAIVIFYIMAKLFDETYDSYIKNPLNTSISKIKTFFNDKTLVKLDAATGISQLQIDSILAKFDKKAVSTFVSAETLAFINNIVITLNAKKSNLVPLIKQLIVGLNNANQLIVQNEAKELVFGKVDLKSFNDIKVNLKDESDLAMSYNMVIIAFNIYAIALKDATGLKNIDNTCIELVDLYEKLNAGMVDTIEQTEAPVELDLKDDKSMKDTVAKIDTIIADDKKELETINKETIPTLTKDIQSETDKLKTATEADKPNIEKDLEDKKKELETKNTLVKSIPIDIDTNTKAKENIQLNLDKLEAEKAKNQDEVKKLEAEIKIRDEEFLKQTKTNVTDYVKTITTKDKSTVKKITLPVKSVDDIDAAKAKIDQSEKEISDTLAKLNTDNQKLELSVSKLKDRTTPTSKLKIRKLVTNKKQFATLGKQRDTNAAAKSILDYLVKKLKVDAGTDKKLIASSDREYQTMLDNFKKNHNIDFDKFIKV